MAANDALLFIDTNKYLDLYRTDKGKKLLAPLGEQMQYIFVTKQVADEVIRNKIQVAAEFLGQKSRGLKLQMFSVPDHLSGPSAGQGDAVLQQMRDIGERIRQVNERVDALVLGIMEQIRRSEDEVSKALAPIFTKAVAHSPEELKKARNRRELGNPPGKNIGPIGDQLSWEQILTHFKGKKRLWIISRDGDYGTVVGRKGFLNSLLYSDLCAVTSEPEVFLFEDTVEGITNFVEVTGARAEKRLTPEEVEEIEIEEKALPDLNPTGEELRRALAGLTNSSLAEEVSRAATAYAKPLDFGEDLRRAAAAYARLPDFGDQLHQAAAVFTKLPDLGDELRRAAMAYAKLPDFGDELRRAATTFAKLPDFGDELRRAAAAFTKLPDLGDELRRTATAFAKFPDLGK